MGFNSALKGLNIAISKLIINKIAVLCLFRRGTAVFEAFFTVQYGKLKQCVRKREMLTVGGSR